MERLFICGGVFLSTVLHRALTSAVAPHKLIALTTNTPEELKRGFDVFRIEYMVGFYDWAGCSDEMKNTGISNPEQTNLLDFMRRTMKLAILLVMMWFIFLLTKK